jgi:hypothetical protein
LKELTGIVESAEILAVLQLIKDHVNVRQWVVILSCHFAKLYKVVNWTVPAVTFWLKEDGRTPNGIICHISPLSSVLDNQEHNNLSAFQQAGS